MKQFLKKLFSHRGEVNYLYFSFFLAFLAFLSLFHFFTWDPPLSRMDEFFILYAIGQALLETSVFVLLAYILKHWAPRSLYFSFIGISFILLLMHFTNFTMVRLMDATIIYIFKFFLGSGIDHLIAGFQALNMNWTMIVLIIFSILFIPVIGLGFYYLTHRLSTKKPLEVGFKYIVITTGVVGSSLFLLDYFAQPHWKQKEYSKYQKTLPLGTTFLSPTPQIFDLPFPIKQFRGEEKTVKFLPKIALAKKPNIFIFVIETFRKDYLKFAPNLVRFGEENIQFEKSYANANSTHLSWFAIFHADLPLYWASMRDNWDGGSIPLRILKNHGYKINVYSAADLHFFNLDRLMFGKDRRLANKIEEYSLHRTLEPCERDRLAFESLSKDLESEGNVYIVFLDSTHSEYSFPNDFPLKYQPISKDIDYLSIGPKSPQLELIKNRYRNSIAYVDQLMGDFLTLLKEKNLYEDAIIAITGDHGEEFFEEGALFHGTHLNEYQTAVPILFRFPAKDWISQTNTATHINMFPSILHYLTKQSDFKELFDGKSIFSTEQPPSRIAVFQNGPDTPLEFALENETCKIRARLQDPQKLEIIELKGFLEPDILFPLF